MNAGEIVPRRVKASGGTQEARSTALLAALLTGSDSTRSAIGQE